MPRKSDNPFLFVFLQVEPPPASEDDIDESRRDVKGDNIVQREVKGRGKKRVRGKKIETAEKKRCG